MTSFRLSAHDTWLIGDDGSFLDPIIIHREGDFTSLTTTSTMKLYRSQVALATLLAAAAFENRKVSAFVPLQPRFSSHQTTATTTTSTKAFSSTIRPDFLVQHGARHRTSLQMANEDFDQSKYTEAAWSSLASLSKVAEYYEANTVDAPHLLEVMINPTKHKAGEDSEAAKRVVEKIFTKAGANMNELRSELEQYFGRQPRVSGSNSQKSMSRSLQKVFEAARSAKEVLGDSFVSTEALVLALVKEDNLFTTSALLKQGIKYTDVLEVVKEMRQKSGPTISRSAENMYDALLKYGIDFTERAKEGKLDPVIGRDTEIRRAIQILSRRTKNNPVLIGDPGVVRR